MPKGRDLKSKLKVYSHNNTNNSNNNSHYHQQQQQQTADRSSLTPSGISVTERITKLRVEQLRAERNRQQRQQEEDQGQGKGKSISDNDNNDSFYTMTSSSSTSTSTMSFSPRVAGPAPPRSWTRRAIVRKAPAAPRLEPPIDSLCSQCAQLATDIVVQNPRLISTLSIATKQHVLNRLGLRLTDRLLSYFRTDEHYSQLNLHSAPISFTWFVRCFWRMEPILSSHNTKNDQQQQEEDWVADDWEEEQEKEEGKEKEEEYYVRYVYDPSSDWALEPVIHLFNQPVDQEHYLMTPLSVKLISLDLSFIPLPGYAVSLIIATLPHLSDLSMAGCFSRDPGLVTMARQMKHLESLNVGYHGWLDLSIIEPIDWKRDLLRLQRLNVAMCGQDFRSGEAIAQHIMEHCPRRQLHIDYSSSSNDAD